MKITPRMAMEVCHHEAVVRQAYYDSGGTLTWSVGLTNASGHNVERYFNNPQSMEKCLEVFIWALRKYAKDVERAFSGHELTEAQFTAALSFHWNTGAIGSATWVKRWKAGDVGGARKAFMWYRKPAAIIDRRKAERDLFFDGKWSGRGFITEYTKLSQSHRPVWSSGVKRDVSGILNNLLGGHNRPAKPKSGGFLQWLLSWLGSLGKQ